MAEAATNPASPGDGGEGAGADEAPERRYAVGELLFGRGRPREPSVRSILRIIVTVVLSALAIYIVYRLRTPISYLLMATFLAVVVSGPIAFLTRRMPKGLAISIVYFGLVLAPVVIGGILIPPLVRAAADLVGDFPAYVDDLKETVNENKTLQDLNENFDLTTKLEDFATDLAGELKDVPGVLADIGGTLVASVFALVTIIIMSLFMVSRGGRWIDKALTLRPPQEAQVIKRALDRMAVAVGAYVGAALLQALIAAILAFIVLEILGVPAPLALAVVIFVLDLIPLVGATLGAILVGIVTLFAADFPSATIIWAIWAIVYQQFENYVIQPRIQGRAVQLDPFIIVIAALFGGTLLGIIGALVAIPLAAAAQIGVREFISYRAAALEVQAAGADDEDGGDPPPSSQAQGLAAS